MLEFKYISKVVLLAGSAITVSAHPTKKSGFNWQDTKYLIAFGDSYTYVQGTAGRQNYSFIGDYQNLAFSKNELLSDEIVQNQTGTAEGGPNWVEYLTGCGLESGLTSPLSCDIQLWDFAFAGADISLEYTPQHHNFTVPFVNQTQQFLDYAEPILHSIIDPKKTLIAIWIGINDIGDSDKYNVSSFPSFYTALQDTLFDSLQTLYDRTSYQNFLIMNLPPLNRTPGNINKTSPLPNATMIQAWDSGLDSHVHAFEKKNQKSNVLVFDANSFLNGVLDRPTEYGIRNTTGYCAAYDQLGIDTEPEAFGCLPLQDYFWFNTGHMTSHTHEVLAREVDRFLKGQ